MDPKGLGAIVTGGGSGLGAAVVRRLSQAGAMVLVVDRDGAAAARVAGEVAMPHEQADVTVEDDVVRVLDQAFRRHGPPRMLVNCAGIGPSSRTVRRDGMPHPLALFRSVLEVNLVGTFAMAAHFSAAIATAPLVGEERGVIVNTASIAAFDGQVGQAAYAASKAGIAGMTLPLARDLAPLAIRVVSIAPGMFMTAMLETVSPEIRKSLEDQVPFPKRMGDPDEFAFLLEHVIRNPMMNGETVRIDAGVRMAAQ